MKRGFINFWLFAALLCTCTNPFKDDEITGAHKKITGKVTVEGVTQPADVYVWLEQINVGVFTDDNGEFALQLPSKATSPEMESLSGTFNLYFMTINFNLDTATVLLRNGEFEYGKADINKNGRLRKDITLSKIFKVVSEVSIKEVFKYGKMVTILTVHSTVSAAMGTATINIPNGTDMYLGAICLLNLDTGEIQLSSSANPLNRTFNFFIPVTTSGIVLEYAMDLQAIAHKNEKYIVIPYIMSATRAPSELYQSLGFDPAYFSTEFAKILFDHQSQVFTIKVEDLPIPE